MSVIHYLIIQRNICYIYNNEGFKFTKFLQKINHLMYKNIPSSIGMEFGIEKCDMLIIKSVKRKTAEGIERNRILGEKENYKYLGCHRSNTVGRVFANGLGDLGSIPGRVILKTLKMVLDTSLLNTQQYKVRIKGKVDQSWETSSALSYTSV